MVEALNEGDHIKQIVGVYDAPLRFKGSDGRAVQISSLALSLADQIRQKTANLDSIIVSLRVNDEYNPLDESEKVRELNSDDDSTDILSMNAYSCQGITFTKKIKLSPQSDIEETINKLASSSTKEYMEIVDFDEHLVDISLDWTNPQFN